MHNQKPSCILATSYLPQVTSSCLPGHGKEVTQSVLIAIHGCVPARPPTRPLSFPNHFGQGKRLVTSRGLFPPWVDSFQQCKPSEITVADAFRRRKKNAVRAVLNEPVLLLGELFLHQGDEMIRFGIEYVRGLFVVILEFEKVVSNVERDENGYAGKGHGSRRVRNSSHSFVDIRCQTLNVGGSGFRCCNSECLSENLDFDVLCHKRAFMRVYALDLASTRACSSSHSIVTSICSSFSRMA